MNTSRTFRRSGKRLRISVIFLALLILGIGCILFFALWRPNGLSRVTVVVASSPVSVWSWDRADHTFVVVSIPSEYVVDAINGYGRYSLEALWKLGFMDRGDGSLLSDSIGDSMGIAAPWYIGKKASDLPVASNAIAYGKGLLSLGNALRFLTGGYRSNMPLSLYLSLAGELSGAPADKITLIDMGKQPVTEVEDLPDGTKRQVINPPDVDRILKGTFEDEQIRKEGMTVALYNTTQTPALGNRAARLLSSYGVLVVFVGNNESQVSRCQMTGDTRALASLTARAITILFDCQIKSAQAEKRADLEVFIGMDYASRFLPRKAHR